MALWDVLSYLFSVCVLGSFTFWVIGYFVVQTFRYVIEGPSEQLKSVGTSILDEPEFVMSGPAAPLTSSGAYDDSLPGAA